ncbi:hypothetical protein EWM64_g1174 [Hericium alpestre]|uniref:DUF6534 domain-containing protein n=1 Tax=Hericium alpestre TaxID=135208 RepID=A0A4Z0AB90_9AGAM|nr:hypothetical protein EWM64_g1174 [Hericium alpestre]
MVAVALILGPVVTAVTTNVFLYGVCVVQWANYYTTGYTDRKLISFLVAWVILLDTFHTAASVYMLWDYVVTNFNNPAILSAAPWPFPSTPIVTVFASVPIQIFLAWRIRQLSHSLWLFAIIAVCSFAQGALGCAGAIGALQTPNINEFTHLIPVVDSWLAIAVVTDGMITVLLTRYLWLSRTGRTDHVIWRIIRSAVETAAFGSFFCVMDLVTFAVQTTLQSTNFHLIFALPMGRLYTNTLMTTLNNRVSLRSQLDQGGGETSFNVATDQFASANAHPVKMTHLKFKSLQSPETIATQGADVEHDIGDGDGDGEHGGDHSSELKRVPVV